ncbi:MAG: response regulator transcription factor [Peptococcaceae bacterium]|nr:response regulator transcription factor [Peptococcaceae bacterium]
MNILLVDDDTDLSAVTADYLEDAGFTVWCAVTAAEALKNLDNAHLILMDITLPDGSGFDLCRRIRQKNEIPIIFISANISGMSKVEGLNIGADDYVTKPYSLGELLARVKARLRRYQINDCHLSHEDEKEPQDSSILRHSREKL